MWSMDGIVKERMLGTTHVRRSVGFGYHPWKIPTVIKQVRQVDSRTVSLPTRDGRGWDERGREGMGWEGRGIVRTAAERATMIVETVVAREQTVQPRCRYRGSNALTVG